MTDNTKMREAMIDQDGAVWEKIGGAWSLYKPAQSVPVEVFDSHCNYASFAGRVCNKCGRIHDGVKSVPVVEPDCYDAGLLGDFGGGNVEWWQDYIRAELARAHDFYASQWPSASVPVVSNVVGYLAGGTLMRRKIQGYACKPLVVQPTHAIQAAELATLREKAAQLEQVEKERDEANARLHDVSVACATAEQERDELRKDAERYRWIRDKSHSLETRQYDKGIVNGPSCYHEVEGIRELKYEGALDAAIDAAIAQEPRHD